MAIETETKDCTSLSDAELAEMGDICTDGPARYDIGLLSKQREEWVLVTLARNGNALQGFSFCTLERIGGTPSVLIGMASVKRTTKRNEALRAILGAQFRRAVLAFPDEDVIIGTRFIDPSGFEAFKFFGRQVRRKRRSSPISNRFRQIRSRCQACQNQRAEVGCRQNHLRGAVERSLG